MRSSRLTILAVPALALLVAGCGGDDSSETTTPTTTATTTALTRAQLIEQGDAICAEVNAAVGTAGSSGAETPSPAARAASLYSGMIASLKNLGAPQETDGYAEFVAAADALAKAEDEVELASERGDSAALSSAEPAASAALASFQAAAGEYGFEDCSEGPKPVSATPEVGGTGAAETPESSEAEAVEEAPEAEEAPETAPETGGAGGGTAGGGTGGGSEGGGGSGGGSGGVGPG